MTSDFDAPRRPAARLGLVLRDLAARGHLALDLEPEALELRGSSAVAARRRELAQELVARLLALRGRELRVISDCCRIVDTSFATWRAQPNSSREASAVALSRSCVFSSLILHFVRANRYRRASRAARSSGVAFLRCASRSHRFLLVAACEPLNSVLRDS